MNKTQLAEAIAARVGVNKKEAEDMVEAFVEITTEQLKKDADVVLAGFGTFSARVRKGRVGVNPQNTSQKIEIKPTKVAKFKTGKNLKDALKNSQAGSGSTTPTTSTTPPPASTPTPEPDTEKTEPEPSGETLM